MKKAIKLSFLLLANTVLLVHVAIPHHHHHNNTAVCILAIHCADNKEMPKHTHDSDCQQHDDGSEMEECPLKEVYVRLENNKLLVDISLDNNFQYPVLLFSFNPMDRMTGLMGLTFRQNPYLLPYYTNYISQSLGLRAPPVC